jgi:hypothetical protein
MLTQKMSIFFKIDGLEGLTVNGEMLSLSCSDRSFGNPELCSEGIPSVNGWQGNVVEAIQSSDPVQMENIMSTKTSSVSATIAEINQKKEAEIRKALQSGINSYNELVATAQEAINNLVQAGEELEETHEGIFDEFADDFDSLDLSGVEWMLPARTAGSRGPRQPLTLPESICATLAHVGESMSLDQMVAAIQAEPVNRVFQNDDEKSIKQSISAAMSSLRKEGVLDTSQRGVIAFANKNAAKHGTNALKKLEEASSEDSE